MAILLVIMVVKIHDAWNGEEAAPPPSGNVNGNMETHIFSSTWKFPSESTYATIFENNLFSNDRKEFIPQEKSAPIMENRVQGKKITLYGVILEKEKRTALIGNPVSGKGASPYLWVTEGQTVEGLKIAGIEKDHILIRNNGKTYQILLHEKDRSRANIQPVVNHEKPSSSDKQARIIMSESDRDASSPEAVKEGKRDAADDGFKTISTPFGDMKVRKN